jgi:hypothetical protein
MKKLTIFGALLGILAAPTAAVADDEIAICQTVPAATPGLSVMGHRVPSASGIVVCVVTDTVVAAVPVVDEQPECGSPCFAVRIDGLQVSENAKVTVNYKVDGQPQGIAFDPDQVSVDPAPGSDLCVVGVGTPDPCTDRVTAPRDLAAKASARKAAPKVSLGWRASEATGKTKIAGYQVWRSETNEPGSFVHIGSSTTTSFVDVQAQRGLTYHYYVIAWDDANNYSPSSNTASAYVR